MERKIIISLVSGYLVFYAADLDDRQQNAGNFPDICSIFCILSGLVWIEERMQAA